MQNETQEERKINKKHITPKINKTRRYPKKLGKENERNTKRKLTREERRKEMRGGDREMFKNKPNRKCLQRTLPKETSNKRINRKTVK